MICKQCGVEFTSKNKRREYCADRCKALHNSYKNKSAPAQKVIFCEWCKAKFKTGRSTTFCCNECRDAAKMAKMKEANLQPKIKCPKCNSTHYMPIGSKTNRCFDCDYEGLR